ncbi:uncharacterized protein LOC103519627 isoform X2 [Diaphorina citri]|uniref:Uncharacterized protein LOC103519627 isoform X2 n=1 Tax=Diaphorina citri TaxID=121845 RepID=A0A1S3DKL4_DIACI|nr:uncharacterized protein LOC103519627 isoform X2 [Diaphorina citri]
MPNQPFNKRAEALAPKKSGGKKKTWAKKTGFKPRKEAISADDPGRQPNPLATAVRDRREPLDLQDLEEALKPQAKGLAPPTKPKNDPTDLEAFACLGLSGFSTQVPIHEITTDDSGYIDIAEYVYEIYCLKDKYFSRSVPRSFFQYYCSMLLWWKKLHTMRPTAHVIRALGSLKQYMPPNPAVPKLLGLYLQGLDRYTDVSGVEWTPVYTLPDEDPINGMTGLFGPMDEVTFGLYLSQFYPDLCAMSILNDISVTNSPPGIDTAYRLPYQADVARRLTRNALGFSSGVRLDRICVNTLEPFGISSIRTPELVHANIRFGVNENSRPNDCSPERVTTGDEEEIELIEMPGLANTQNMWEDLCNRIETAEKPTKPVETKKRIAPTPVKRKATPKKAVSFRLPNDREQPAKKR